VAFSKEQVVPRLVAVTCGASALSGLRARTASGLAGRVVGAGVTVEDVEQKYGGRPRAWAYLTRAATVRA
jgi:hypothetical protein